MRVESLWGGPSVALGEFEEVFDHWLLLVPSPTEQGTGFPELWSMEPKCSHSKEMSTNTKCRFFKHKGSSWQCLVLCYKRAMTAFLNFNSEQNVLLNQHGIHILPSSETQSDFMLWANVIRKYHQEMIMNILSRNTCSCICVNTAVTVTVPQKVHPVRNLKGISLLKIPC